MGEHGPQDQAGDNIGGKVLDPFEYLRKDKVDHDHDQEGIEHDPNKSEGRSLIPNLEVPGDKVPDQFAVLKNLPELSDTR